jgi:hypothetical protein
VSGDRKELCVFRITQKYSKEYNPGASSRLSLDGISSPYRERKVESSYVTERAATRERRAREYEQIWERRYYSGSLERERRRVEATKYSSGNRPQDQESTSPLRHDYDRQNSSPTDDSSATPPMVERLRTPYYVEREQNDNLRRAEDWPTSAEPAMGSRVVTSNIPSGSRSDPERSSATMDTVGGGAIKTNEIEDNGNEPSNSMEAKGVQPEGSRDIESIYLESRIAKESDDIHKIPDSTSARAKRADTTEFENPKKRYDSPERRNVTFVGRYNRSAAKFDVRSNRSRSHSRERRRYGRESSMTGRRYTMSPERLISVGYSHPRRRSIDDRNAEAAVVEGYRKNSYITRPGYQRRLPIIGEFPRGPLDQGKIVVDSSVQMKQPQVYALESDRGDSNNNETSERRGRVSELSERAPHLNSEANVVFRTVTIVIGNLVETLWTRKAHPIPLLDLFCLDVHL